MGWSENEVLSVQLFDMFISKRLLPFVTLDISYPRVSHFKSSYFDSDCFWDLVFIMSNYPQKKKKPNSSAYSLLLLSFTQSSDLKFNEKLHNLSVSPRVISSLLLTRERQPIRPRQSKPLGSEDAVLTV